MNHKHEGVTAELTYNDVSSVFTTVYIPSLDPDEWEIFINKCSHTYREAIKKHSDMIETMKLIPALPYVLIFVCYMSVLSAPFVPTNHFSTYINCLFFGFMVAAGLPVVHFCGLMICRVLAHAIAYERLRLLIQGENKCRFVHKGYRFQVCTSIQDVVQLRYCTIQMHQRNTKTVFNSADGGFADMQISTRADRVVLTL
jgi:hypothetical protein